MLPFCPLGGCCEQIAHDFPKSNWIRHSINHECRERLGNIQRNIATLFNGGRYIHTMRLQSLKESLPVGLGCANDHRVPCFQSGFEETSKGNYKRRIVIIKLNHVAAGGVACSRRKRWEILLVA